MKYVITTLFLFVSSLTSAQSVVYPPSMLRDEGIDQGRLYSAIDFTGALINCTWTNGVGTCNVPAIASTVLTDTANIPRLDALTNSFVSAVTTQNGGLSVAGTGVTSGHVLRVQGSSASPGANSTASVKGTGLHVFGNLGSTSTNTSVRNSLAAFVATNNSASASAALTANIRAETIVSNTTAGQSTWGIFSTVSDNVVLANTTIGVEGQVNISGNVGKIATGLRGIASSSGLVSSAFTETLYGVRGSAISTPLNNAGAIANVYGGHFRGGGFLLSGTINSYGVFIVNAETMNTTGTSRNVGLYVETPTGADTNYAALLGGLVGIGTETPLSTLSINGGLHVGGDSDAGDNNALIDGTLGVTGLSNLDGGIAVDTSNFTVSGTTGALRVNGTANMIELNQSAAGSATYYVMDNTVETGGKRYRFGYTGAVADKGSFTLYNQTDGITPLTVLTGGNVGIGTTAPTVPLHVGSVAGLAGRDLVFFGGTVTPTSSFGTQLSVRTGTINAAVSNNAAVVFVDGTINKAASGTHANFSGLRLGTLVIGAATGVVTDAATLQIDGAPTGATNNFALNIDSGTVNLGTGNVGIGTTAPVQKLVVSGATGSPASSGTTQGGFFRLNASNGTALDHGALVASPFTHWLQTGDTSNLATTYPLALNPNGGNVGIGDTTPDATLEVAGGDIGISTQGNGLILKATDGATCYRLTVNNAGTLATASVTCP